MNLRTVIAIALLLAGCGRFRREAIAPAEAQAAPQPRVIVVLIDFSATTQMFRDQYRSDIVNVVENLRESDALALLKINESSLGSGGSQSLFTTMDVPPEPGEAKNALTRRLRDERHAKAVAAKRDVVRKNVEKFLKETAKAPWTEIMAGLANADKVIDQHSSHRPILIVFSDMIEESRRYNFAKKLPTARRRLQILETERATNRLPDLTGVRVHVVAPMSGGDSEKFLRLQDFWMAYFKAANAKLRTENYAASLGPVE
jgi:hypothetical protein